MDSNEIIQKNETVSNEIVSLKSNLLFDSNMNFDSTFGFIPFNNFD